VKTVSDIDGSRMEACPSVEAVRQQQTIGRRTSFWSAGPQVWSW